MDFDWVTTEHVILFNLGTATTAAIILIQRGLWSFRYGRFCVKCGSYGGKRKEDDAPLEFSEEAVKSVAAKYKYLHDELMSEYNSPEVKAKLCQIGIPNWRKHLDKEEKSD